MTGRCVPPFPAGLHDPVRQISDLGFGEFFRRLEYKTQWYGSSLWAADRWFPSSRLCSGCGAVNGDLTLADRTWTCRCGLEHDRDVNAARNLLAAMRLERQAASLHVAGQFPGDAKRLWRRRKTPAIEADANEAGTRITEILRTAHRRLSGGVGVAV
ncbi:hypothetical protein Sme01_53740 [Sphaerisporangium melleum]|uniref:zinc ribbon domain-containing protein n=1 Tax=Sphaerisporangium melleum TaxID=321316 RepID=UPI001A4426F6|nr:hypothetical protein Sme01_53740 [Sphaerisporangium melleum]